MRIISTYDIITRLQPLLHSYKIRPYQSKRNTSPTGGRKQGKQKPQKYLLQQKKILDAQDVEHTATVTAQHKESGGKKMTILRTVEMQYQFNGEWFEIWETTQTTLEKVLEEMGSESPSEKGWIRFQGEDKEISVNGGF